MTAKPIDFVYDFQTDSYDLSKIESDEDLLTKIRTGTTEQTIYRNFDHIIQLDQDLFGDIKPTNFYQNQLTGQNNIESATYAIY